MSGRSGGARSARRAPARTTLLAVLLLVPSMVVFVAFNYYPLARTVFLGLHRTDFFGGNRQWVGPSQYWEVLTDPDTIDSLWTTVAYTLLTVPTGLVLGVLLAVLADRPLRGIGVIRALFASTVATSVAVASLVFLVLLNPSIGILTDLLPFDVLARPGVLNDPGTALYGVAATTIWQNLGLTFIVVTAGLQSIPDELREAAELDGMGPFRRFFEVTLPLISPTLLFGVVVLTTVAFQSFGQIDLLTQGGPLDRTNVLVYSVYDNAFGGSVDEGVASVQAVSLFVIVAVLAALQFRFVGRQVTYG